MQYKLRTYSRPDDNYDTEQPSPTISTHKLEIEHVERGRYCNPSPKPVPERQSIVCQTGAIEGN